MASPLDKFVERLTRSGLMSDDEVQAFIDALPDEQKPANGEQLAKMLVRKQKITAYQAHRIYAGKGDTLVMGNYVVLDKLGEGGMGVVLKAEHKRMKRNVALKVMSVGAMKSPDAVERFHREVEAAARLEHANIVAAYDADEANGVHFLVMSYVDGMDLPVFVKEKGPLPADQAITYIVQAARGLDYAHNEGVVHRDIKPANLLLDKKGVVQILDMGLARLDTGDVDQAELTSTGQIMGTVDYMAPEQALSTKSADARSDIYSLGISLWYLITGRTAYEGESLTARLMAHQQAPVPSLAPYGAPAELDAVFQKMAAKLPEDRYQTMAEVVSALSELGDATSSPYLDVDTSESRRLSQFLQTSSHAGELTGNQTQAIASPPTEQFDQTLNVDSASVDTSAKTEEMFAPTFVAQAKTLKPQAKPATAKRTWIIAAAISGAVCFLLLLAGVFFFQTPTGGTLRVEINDPNITVSVKGTKIILQGAEKKDIALEPGMHALHVKRGNFEFDTDLLIIKKGELVVVRVEIIEGIVRAMRDGAVIGSKSAAESPPTSPEPLRYVLEFDGVNDRVELPNQRFDKMAEFTLEAWVRNWSGRVLSIGAGGDPENCFSWWHNVERVKADFEFGAGTNGEVLAAIGPNPNTWHHLALVAAKGQIHLYLDGRPIAAGPATLGPLQSKRPVVIGTLLGSTGEYDSPHASGEIRGLRISRVTRYKAEFVPPNDLSSDTNTLALYHFDEGSGDVLKDSSGNDHHGKIVGARWVNVNELWVREPRKAPALEFDGIDDYVSLGVKLKDVGLFDPDRPFTYEAFVTPHADQPNNGPGPAGTPGIMGVFQVMSVSWGKFPFVGVHSDPAIYPKSKTISTEEEHHLAVVWDGRTQRFFIDGRLVGKGTPQYRPKLEAEYDWAAFTLAGMSPKANNFAGVIGEIRISNTARYVAEFEPEARHTSDRHTLALYHCEEGAGDVLKDSSGGKRHGKIVGAKWVRVGVSSAPF